MSGDSKGENMDSFLNTSLERLALMKIATLLFSNGSGAYTFRRKKIRNIPQYPKYKHSTRSVFGSVEYRTGYSVQNLPLPAKLKDKICSLFRPIAVQVVYWMKCDENIRTEMFERNLRNVSWSPRGIIDKRKTYEPVVKIQTLDVEYRYKLACTCCLEDDIPILWDQMLETKRNEIILNTGNASMTNFRDLSGGFLYFWSCVMKGEVFRLKDMTENYPSYTPNQYMFEYAAEKGNKAALEYFLKKLTPEEKNESLLVTAKRVCEFCFYSERYKNPNCYYGDILCFLLSQIEKEHHKDIIKENDDVLLYFLEWPCQSFLLDIADLVWADIEASLFVNLLHNVAVKIMLHYKDYNYRGLIDEFCHRSLPNHKKYIIDQQWSDESGLATLLVLGDEKNIKLILKDATTEEIKKLIFDHSGKCVCPWLFALTYDWLSSEDDDFCDAMGLYRNFVCEYISNKDDIEKFKDGIKNHVLHSWGKRSDYITTYQMKNMDSFLNSLPNGGVKRSAEDDV